MILDRDIERILINIAVGDHDLSEISAAGIRFQTADGEIAL